MGLLKFQVLRFPGKIACQQSESLRNAKEAVFDPDNHPDSSDRPPPSVTSHKPGKSWKSAQIQFLYMCRSRSGLFVNVM